MVLKSIAEIALISMFVYLVLRFLQGTRGAGILRGLVILFVLAFVGLSVLASAFNLHVINYLLNGFLAGSLLFLVIIYQQEIRRGLVSLGQIPFLKLFFKAETSPMDEVTRTVLWLAERKIGALIAVERQVGLGNYAETGTKIDSEITLPLLSTIFWPGSPLHDGAVIVQGSKVAAAACILPISENMDRKAGNGFRHRAAVGITEETDAMVIVVSEETGQISVGTDGRLVRNMPKESLGERLEDAFTNGVQRPDGDRRSGGRTDRREEKM